MLISQNILISMRALLANKLRSALTMLGIIIGVGAVVALMAIGNGAANSITSEVEGIGSNLIFVRPGRQQMDFRSQAQAQTSRLYLEDYEILAEHLTGVAGVSPLFQGSYTVQSGDQSYRMSVTGAMPDYLAIRAYELAAGRNLTQNDLDTLARVAVIGAQAAEDLFGNLNPLGKTVKIDGVKFEVVGVLAAKGSSGLENPDDLIMIPLETGYRKLFGSAALDDGQHIVNSILFSAASSEGVEEVMAQAEYLLRRQHALAPTEESDFSIQSQNDFLSTLDTITSTLTIFLGAIAAISLLVGGIGIMNIMLVSVTERTKEIGLRKSVGARKDHILVQFLVETMTLSILGGVIGIAFGLGVALLISALGLITAQILIQDILMAFFFAVAVGLFFGIYPAYRAASLHPMEALRYE